MDFQYTPEQEAFRKELRGWLAANLPKDLCVDDPTDERVVSHFSSIALPGGGAGKSLPLVDAR